MKVAIGFLSKDRTELSRRTIEPIHNGQHALFWFDGSDTEEGQKLPSQYACTAVYGNVRGGPGAAIVYALCTMLDHPAGYTHVGLLENDTLLPADWFEPTMALFDNPDLVVGAASARTYVDRILIQRDGYAVMHNLGAGHIVFTREAAEIVLDTFRSAWTTDNRRIFNRLTGLDIGTWWAFRAASHWLTADWHWEAALACVGLAAVAPTPSRVEMIGQTPPLAEQGLAIATDPVEDRRDETAFWRLACAFGLIRHGSTVLGIDPVIHRDPEMGTTTIFPHQLPLLGGSFGPGWTYTDRRGIGPFVFEAAADQPHPRFMFPICGACVILMSGGRNGGRVRVIATGYDQEINLAPEGEQVQVRQLLVPAHIQHHWIEVRALTPGVRLYGVQTREPQMTGRPTQTFADWTAA